ncbi:coiled-coil domain-containing protein [Candidatus Nanohalobium constans]|uniref:Chromosome segregation ATPase n=1 Tax=Candidatus Nanohalobium constans TaxID=2565781 RepID=A0A5Q0UH49_9ARCH|nr:hypothetical protein [Candidatus Nanohalobium constans]QGA80691.1 chromosome segregation ATPase [Candidatus Nanohalobium constans]
MAQPLLKRRLNPLLLISTVAALSLLAGVAVLSQDQISDKQNRISELKEERNSLDTEVTRLDARVSNMSVKLREYEGDLGELRAEKQNLSDTVDEKNDRISELESEVENARESRDLEDTLNDINSSMSVVCAESSGGSGAEHNCNRWGHEVGTSNEG